MSIGEKLVAVVKVLAIILAIGVLFGLGFAGTVYLSLRSPAVTVPEVVGKDRFVAENELGDAGLRFRVRAYRPSNQVKADTVLFQLPHAGEVVKAGQTIAVDVSRAAKEGEVSESVTPEETPSPSNANDANDSSSGNSNENKPKKNKNANANANGNTNGNTNARNSNANRPNANANASPKVSPNVNANKVNANAAGTGTTNSNRNVQPGNANSNRPNRNTNRTPPVVAPTPPRR